MHGRSMADPSEALRQFARQGGTDTMARIQLRVILRGQSVKGQRGQAETADDIAFLELRESVETTEKPA